MNMLNPPILPNPLIEAFKKDVDQTLIEENLKLSHEERLLNLMQLQRFAEALQKVGREARRRHD